ncbi:hypothetical protein SUGI_0061680 [Cryptomeria japonica]|uniref:protein ASPARTIC PROTEASE IN GUARD CELL 2 n=1 Tax=Cryptomeria japonica TaxID=3369 RepID=UPI002408A66F|nr:protein ASPARTIC PROTEASE IN GUARD CELL 2 [Cryptomeria japonica]GLJ07211.1 hypothetical protein SUGI_0061680 [Cryptomeria japonica]
MDSAIRSLTLLLLIMFTVTQSRESKAAPRLKRFPAEATEKNLKTLAGPLWLPLLHRDSITKATNLSYEQRTKQMLERDALRVAAINARLKDLQTKVFSGIPQNSNEYFTRIRVGSQAREQAMAVDTGSDNIWIQCQPCKVCYSQTDPLFDPALSSTFKPINCSSYACRQLHIGSCDGNGNCLYEVYYGDKSHTTGNLAMETLTIGKVSVRNAVIGCSHTSHGLFVAHAGILGLGRGSLSLPSQLSHYYAGIFSYCLVDRNSNRSSTLDFGPQAVPPGAVFAPLLSNARHESFYYVSLVGISVAGKKLAIEESVFLPDQSGHGGTIIDSSTVLTRLPTDAFLPLRDAFVAAFVDELPLSDENEEFGACYYPFEHEDHPGVPTIDFHFSNNATLSLPRRNVLVKVNDKGTFCLAFLETSSSISIIGNVQQQGIRVSYDTVNRLVGFTLNSC